MHLFPLSLKASKSCFGELVIGYNRYANDRKEVVTEEQAVKWFKEDWEKARKRVAKYQLNDHDPSIYVSFLIGHRRFSKFVEFFESIRDGHRIHACIFLGNSREFSNNPDLVTGISDSILKGESQSEFRQRLGQEVAELVRRGSL